jgi:small subunit ribosomal protein S15e
MADQQYDAQDSQEIKKNRTFKKFTFRGVDLEQLLELNNEQVRFSLEFLHGWGMKC